MALKELSEKLDSLNKQDLGIDFNEAGIWIQLNNRLDNNRFAFYWWFAAACLVLLTLLPISVLKETEPAISGSTEYAVVVDHSLKEPAHNIEEKFAQLNTHVVPVITPQLRKHAELEMAKIRIPDLTLVPIELSELPKEKVVFNIKDITIIQASLESPTNEKGRKITIRAQWQNSPNEVHVNNQALKIKLYEKNK